MHCPAMSGSGSWGRAALICRFAESSSIALYCSGESDARGRGGSSCADAELCTIGGGTATRLVGRRNGLRECCYALKKAFCEVNVDENVAKCCSKARLTHEVNRGTAHNCVI